MDSWRDDLRMSASLGGPDVPPVARRRRSARTGVLAAAVLLTTLVGCKYGPSDEGACTTTVSTVAGLNAANSIAAGPLTIVCINPGTYSLTGSALKWTRQNTVLRGVPSGATLPRINGQITVAATDVTVSQLDLRHTGLYSSTIRFWEDYGTLTKSRVSSTRGTCVEVGYANRQAAAPVDVPGADYSGFHRVKQVSITDNTIDGCASDATFLSGWTCNNSGLPGIYSQWTEGLLVSGNVITNTALRGIQLYPSNDNVNIRENLMRANSIAMNIGTTDVSWARASNIKVESNVFAEQSSNALAATYPNLRNPANGGTCAGNKFQLYNSPDGVTIDDQATEYSSTTTVDPSVTVTGNCGDDVQARIGYTTSFTWSGNTNAVAQFVSTTDHHQTAASPCKAVGPVRLRPSA